jgi:2'-5' RNA ligase
MNQKRLFIAVPLEDEAVHQIKDIQLSWKNQLQLPEETLVPAEKWHLTLHFLGQADEQLIPRWIAALEPYAKTPSFSIYLNRFLAFPNNDIAKVITLAGSSGNSPLSHLFFRMKKTVEELKVKVEERVFIPHITLFRGSFLPIQTKINLEKEQKLSISQFALYESRNTNGKNHYHVLNRWLLS